MSKKQKGLKKIAPYLYISPISLILIVFVVGSVIISFALGFTKYTIIAPPTFHGFNNYIRLFHDTKFLKCLSNTIKLMLYIVPLQLVTGVLVSVFLVPIRNRWIGKVANYVIFIPFLCSGAVCGVVWREFLNGKIAIVEKFFGIIGYLGQLLRGGESGWGEWDQKFLFDHAAASETDHHPCRFFVGHILALRDGYYYDDDGRRAQ